MENETISALSQTPSTDAFTLSPTEEKILSLWDQSLDLQLSHALLESQPSIPPSSTSSISPSALTTELEVAEQALLSARTTYMLRNKITTHVLTADPILKSVHEASTANALERRLLPLIHERDALALTHSHLSSKLRALQHEYSTLEAAIAKLNGENQALAAQLFGLTDALSDRTVEEVDDARLRGEIEGLEEEMGRARRRWRVMKGLVRGVVVGSGVEWARRKDLVELVLDGEEDG